MQILLTGASGFIGQHLLSALFAEGHQIVGCVRQPERWQIQFPHIKWLECGMQIVLLPCGKTLGFILPSGCMGITRFTFLSFCLFIFFLYNIFFIWLFFSLDIGDIGD